MNKIVYVILGAAVLLAVSLFYFILAPNGKPILSFSQWSLLGGFASALALAAFLPGLLRWRRGLPQEPLSPADLRFALALVAVLCPLVFFAIWTFGPFGSFVIVLVPIAFIIRSPRRSQLNRK